MVEAMVAVAMAEEKGVEETAAAAREAAAQAAGAVAEATEEGWAEVAVVEKMEVVAMVEVRVAAVKAGVMVEVATAEGTEVVASVAGAMVGVAMGWPTEEVAMVATTAEEEGTEARRTACKEVDGAEAATEAVGWEEAGARVAAGSTAAKAAVG